MPESRSPDPASSPVPGPAPGAVAPDPGALGGWPKRDARHLLVSGAQMAALEQHLFNSGLPVEALMEKAALRVSRELMEHHAPRLHEHGAVVLVGPGHNGGDGLVVARELHLAGVNVAIWSPFERHKPLTASHLAHAQWLGIPRLGSPPQPAGTALWIDAVFGIGQRRPLEPQLEALLAERDHRQPAGLVAIDVPSGLCADLGHCLGRNAARASHTYCVGLLKTGLVQDGALGWVGRLVLLELGLPAQLLAELPGQQPLGLTAADLDAAPWPQPDPAATKYGRGRLLVVAGSGRFRGAADLALAGASASGCGSLRAALPDCIAGALWQRAPHVVLSRALPCHQEGGLQLEQLQAIDLERLDALLLGPGLGPAQSPGAGEAAGLDRDGEAWELLRQVPYLLVLDADGLNRLAGHSGGAIAWLQRRQGPTWLTPHHGEFTRLFPQLGSLSPLEAAAAAAQASGATVLLKGAHTVVAGAGGERWQLLDTAPAAARAGLGDVLAGYAAGLGAMGAAASGPGAPPLLALAALAHASAAKRLAAQGRGLASPTGVAESLARCGHGNNSSSDVLFCK